MTAGTALDKRPPNWREQAACRLDPERWFVGRIKADGEARHVCLYHCPVVEPCHADTQRPNPPEHGVEGGILWVHKAKPPHGRPAQHQPLAGTCGDFCQAWRHE